MMGIAKKMIEPEKIILLILILSLSILSLSIVFGFDLTEASNFWTYSILFYFSFFGIAFTFLYSLTYYVSRFFLWAKGDEGKIRLSLAVLLGLGYSAFEGVMVGAWMIFFSKLFYSGLAIIIGMPILSLLSKVPKLSPAKKRVVKKKKK